MLRSGLLFDCLQRKDKEERGGVDHFSSFLAQPRGKVGGKGGGERKRRRGIGKERPEKRAVAATVNLSD